ncbi:hypothetical protein [Dyella sp. C11]|nr:hypothetical protein [Dyella sp. C11]
MAAKTDTPWLASAVSGFRDHPAMPNHPEKTMSKVGAKIKEEFLKM